MSLAFFEGEFRPSSSVSIPVTDLALQRGVGVFDSLAAAVSSKDAVARTGSGPAFFTGSDDWLVGDAFVLTSANTMGWLFSDCGPRVWASMDCCGANAGSTPFPPGPNPEGARRSAPGLGIDDPSSAAAITGLDEAGIIALVSTEKGPASP